MDIKEPFLEFRQEVLALIAKANFFLSPEELDSLQLNDFGLGNFRREGVAFIDIHRSTRVRITILTLLPNQALPEHKHPPYYNEQGKEETLRILYGSMEVYRPGIDGIPKAIIPSGKGAYYTSRKCRILSTGEQIVLPPDEFHWFRAGIEGVTVIEFQNSVDESRNIFSDPGSTGVVLNR